MNFRPTLCSSGPRPSLTSLRHTLARPRDDVLNPMDTQTTLQEAFTSKVRNAGRRFTSVWSIWHWWNDTLDTGLCMYYFCQTPASSVQCL